MTSLPVKDINKMSRPAGGETKEGGALFFDLPRTDLKPVLFDVDIEPAKGFDREARSLRANGFRVTAVHHRELFVEP